MPDDDRAAPLLFVVVGLAMISVAATDYLSSAVAVAFAVMGAGLVVVGGCLRLIEGTLKLGPQGVEATLRKQRVEQIIEAVRATAPDEEPFVREVIRWIDPSEGMLNVKIRQQIAEHERAKMRRREMIERFLRENPRPPKPPA